VKEVLARRRATILLVTPATKQEQPIEIIEDYWYKYVCLKEIIWL